MSLADPSQVAVAVAALKAARSPLVIVGKGAAYGRAEAEVKALLELTGLPFLPTPMGKGVVDDDHPLCIAPARSKALGGADFVLLIGARLNWILHFGKAPRFRNDVKVVQIDIAPEEIHTNVHAVAALTGHVKPVVAQLVEEIKHQGYRFARTSPVRFI